MRSRDELAEEFAIQATGTDIHTSHLQGCAENIIAWGYQLADALIARRSPPPAASEPAPVVEAGGKDEVGSLKIAVAWGRRLVESLSDRDGANLRIDADEWDDIKTFLAATVETPAERLAAGLPVETSVTPPASEARPTHVRIIDCRGLPQFRGEIVTVTRWSDGGRPFAPGCGGDFELPDGSWESLNHAPTPAATTTEEEDRRAFDAWWTDAPVSRGPFPMLQNVAENAARCGYLAGLAAARKEPR